MWRHDVASVAKDEEFTRLRLRDQIGVDARVRTRDKERLWRLAVREAFKEFPLRSKD
jgi:hypothetical protein